MRKSLLNVSINLLVLIVFANKSIAQQKSEPAKPDRPKLVVGLVVDQMRWDFFYRFYDRYGEDGFKRILNQGFRCENAMIPYAQTVTAAGHSCVYTGSTPAINGIMGNEWYDRYQKRAVYCVEDNSVKTIGGSETAEPMSPKNLWVTTITDEMRIATNFRSKTIGIAIKDRGSILPAGHTGDAYWYDAATGNWVTSTFYKSKLPQWVNKFNNKKMPNEYYSKNWNTLYPIETYVQSTADNKAYEGRFIHEAAPVFPHKLDGLIDTNFGILSATPYGNTYTLEFAKEALQQEALGTDEFTDFLAISLSSPDYIGHQFGPNSIEIEDTYLRLDLELASFFKFLDEKVGKDNYLFFITADHGVAHVPGFLQENKVPVNTIGSSVASLGKQLAEKYGLPDLIKSTSNYHLYLDREQIAASDHDLDEIVSFIITELNKDPELLMAFDASEISEANLPASIKEQFILGYNTKLGGDVIFIPKPGKFYGRGTGTTHGAWYPYDAHIPLVFMGKNVKPGETHEPVYMSDIAATLAAILKIQMPSGCIGKPVEDLLEQ